jgi:hypothetical protein
MIKFFREIRQNLLMENKTGKYFKYAIGEILLVVIGILIALQINNWNEERKSKKLEKVFLTQILKSLKSDLGRTRGIYKFRALEKNNAISQLINELNQENLPHDSILYPLFNKIGITLSFNYDKGAYESLKSQGLNIIQNDSLRQKIVRIYENDLPLGIEFINLNRQFQHQLRENYELELTEYNFERSKNGKWVGGIDVDFKKIKNSNTLKKLIRLEEEVALNYKYRLENEIKDFESLILLIENQLKNLN